MKRTETGGKGLDGVLEKAPDYFNPFLESDGGTNMSAVGLLLATALAGG